MSQMSDDPDMLDEYDFSNGIRGKYADRYKKGPTDTNPAPDIEISQNIKEISGIIQLDEDFDLKSEYKKYIRKKYS